MSRDAFPDDPRDTADSPQTRSVRERSAARTEVRRGGNRTESILHDPAARDSREQRPRDDDRGEAFRAYYLRDRAYLLRASELHSMTEIGKFRVVAAADLAASAYGGDSERMDRDVRHLRKQGLVTDKTVEISRKKTLRVVTLTKTGKRLLRTAPGIPEDQTLYHGLRKPREVRHDADLYRVYQKEAARIEQAGGRPVRVLLDYELKANLNRDLARLDGERINPDRKREVAEKHGLEVVNGKIPVPDMRVEYETSEAELTHVDLELATREYRPQAVSEKAAAGFSMYARPEDASRLRRILDDREITAGILSL
jgi:hypothetical protein